jgi:chromosome segregation ATPase
METKELENHLRRLDQTVLALGQSIQNARNRIAQCQIQADHLESQAHSLMSMASNEEDGGAAAQLYSQANACMNQASSYRMQAENLQSQAEGMMSELNGHKSEYQSYMSEGQTNLSNLKIAADQLTSIAGNKYGASKIREALSATKQRMIYNQNLVNGCQKRISWIEQLCGSSGDSYVNVKRR